MSKATPATLQMKKSGRPFELLEYTYDPEAPSIGLQAAEALGLPAAQVFKTLMVMAADEAVIAIIPSDKELSLKALAHVAGKKAAAMMKAPDAERITGYKVGGISPLGQKKRLRVFMDASAQAFAFMVVNGGRRGLQIKAAPADLVAVTGATVIDLAV
ncbi:Cys-tRNA(Pro) deacylase [Magnetospirillum moscoviense]|uniref:Cys-tRNA(Pro)/Cys-tRNA(Cys) deacylase n=1 Tax=Magnetospirillum moscoviense TaxID=1437059 RepID=A0A178MZK0_9PROT|nr:Cys-tRNA(Pro) deacylase [Magnetospirillum moscoviense]OAN66481.1 aminoacyl-tRNA deacylase [Magnetospirillum moscoviense]